MKQMAINLLAVLLLYGFAYADNPDPIALIGIPEDGLDVEQTIAIEGVAGPSRDSTTVTWVLEYGEGESPTTWIQLANGNTVVGYPRTWQEPDPETSDYGLFYNWDTTQKPDGYYTVRLTVTDGANKIATDQSLYYFDNAHLYGDEDGEEEEPLSFLLEEGIDTIFQDDMLPLTTPPHGRTQAPSGPIGVPTNGTYRYFTPWHLYGSRFRNSKRMESLGWNSHQDNKLLVLG